MEKRRDEISKTTNSLVYKYFSKKHNRVVCKKVLKTNSEEKMEKFKKEPIFLEKLRDNENCIQLISYKYVKEGRNYVCKILTEYYEKGNLKSFISELNKQRLSLSDSVLNYMIKFINFFADLQTQNISHRDIKPENIFITRSGEMKIGDFGCSTFTTSEDQLYTIQGTAIYLSPELRVGYDNFKYNNGKHKINHCPYKSDVFSLGLVFLYVSLMRPISDNQHSIKELEIKVSQCLIQVNNPIVKHIISKMLIFESLNRPDFIKLRDLLNECLKSICGLCKNDIKEPYLYCKNCDLKVHSICTSSKICQKCNNSFYIKCKKCGIDCLIETNCSHFLCEICAVTNFDCKECCKINLIVDLAPVSINYQDSYFCRFDQGSCGFNSRNLIYCCVECNRSYCAVCKQESHNSLCLENQRVFDITCKCNTQIQIIDLDSIFYLCETCGFRCIVCMKSINFDHLHCSKLLQNLRLAN